MIESDPRDTELQALRAQLGAMTAKAEALKLRAERAEHERNEFRKLYVLVAYELERLKRQLFGKKAETVDPTQVQLFFGPVLDALERARQGGEAERSEVESQLESLRERARAEVARRKAERKPPKPHGRRDLSLEDLPVETIVLDPPELKLAGGETLVRVGEETSDHVDYRPATLVRVHVVRTKWRRPGDDEGSPIVIAPLPERPIPKGMAGPGLLAHVLVSKFADHLPLHRQETMFRRAGLRLPRSTLCGFVQGSASLLGRVVDAMWEDAKKNARWIGTDATGALVFAKEQCRRNHFWVAVAERDHVLFRHTKAHDGQVPADLFKGFRGYLLADASAVYHELYRQAEGDITEVGCWAHARRKLFDALGEDEPRALVGIGFIGLLYDAHRLATDPKTGITNGAQRRADAASVIEKLYAWIAAERSRVAYDSLIVKAMNYIVNHKVPLTRFLDDGILRLDNNLSEIELRREVVGRRNWLFCGSDEGAHWNTVAVSLIASCQLKGIEPWAYLRDVLTLLPAWPVNSVLELSPKHWNETSQKPHTQQLVASLRLLGSDTSHSTETTLAA